MNKDEIIEGLHQAIVSLKQTIFRKDIELKEVTDAYHKYVAEKLKEPCAHEPDTLADHGYHVWLCRCGAKIKAKEWIEV